MLEDTRRASKNNPPNIGPYTIARSNPNGTYTLRDSANGIYHRDVTRDMIKSVTDTNESGQTFKYIYSILQDRNKQGQKQYLIQWADGSEPTWEPPTNIQDFEELMKEYLSNKRKLPQPPTQKDRKKHDQTQSHQTQVVSSSLAGLFSKT